MTGFIQNLELKHKLSLLVGASIIAICIVMIFALQIQHSNMLEDRKQKTQQLVQTAYSAVKHFHNEFTQGTLSKELAQSAALSTIKSMEYGEHGYFWVNDMNPTMLMHPVKPALVGQNIGSSTDANGKFHFKEMTQVVKSQGEGFVEYTWANPALANKASKKVSYVKGFKPWGWIIGTGIYLDDVDKVFTSTMSAMLGILAVSMLGVIGLSAYIIKSITAPLQQLSDTMSHVESTGDLTMTCTYSADNELGRISKSFNSLIRSFNQSLNNVKTMHSATNAALNEMTLLADETSQNTNTAQERVSFIASAINELVTVLTQVSHNTVQASNTTQEVNQNTIDGKSTVDHSVGQIQTLAHEIDQTGLALEELNTEVGRISGVTNIISSIAEQTNLLALNAAIEAARAGEQGRGFAVVADEVRSLSIRTQESTNQILDIISALQEKSKTALKTVEQGKASADESVNQALSAGNKLQNIAEQVTKLADMNAHVAVAAEEQEATIQHINQEIEVIVEAINNSSDCAMKTSQSSDNLKSKAYELNQSINRFKTA